MVFFLPFPILLLKVIFLLYILFLFLFFCLLVFNHCVQCLSSVVTFSHLHIHLWNHWTKLKIKLGWDVLCGWPHHNTVLLFPIIHSIWQSLLKHIFLYLSIDALFWNGKRVLQEINYKSYIMWFQESTICCSQTIAATRNTGPDLCMGQYGHCPCAPIYAML